MRYRWYASVKAPCNWKAVMNAFNEAYHGFATHPQMIHVYCDDVTRNKVRYAPGAELELERKLVHGDDDWRDFRSISPLLQQDFDNVGEVQRGMKSRGFTGSRTNPLQEATVSNCHRVICSYIDGDAPTR